MPIFMKMPRIARSKTISPERPPTQRMQGRRRPAMTSCSQLQIQLHSGVSRGAFITPQMVARSGGSSWRQMGRRELSSNSLFNRSRWSCRSMSVRVVSAVISSPSGELKHRSKSADLRKAATRRFSSSRSAASGRSISLMVVKMPSSRFSMRPGSCTLCEVSWLYLMVKRLSR